MRAYVLDLAVREMAAVPMRFPSARRAGWEGRGLASQEMHRLLPPFFKNFYSINRQFVQRKDLNEHSAERPLEDVH